MTRPTQTVASALVELLAPRVGRAFNVPGAGNLPFLVAWSEHGLPWFTALEEKRGALMAEGYAKASRRLALMSTTAGPGVTNLATALYVALTERAPLFVVAGQTPRNYATRRPVQQLDTRSVARELTLKALELTAPEQLEGMVTELVRVALDARHQGPVLLAVPADLWHAGCSLQGPLRLPEAWTAAAARRTARLLQGSARPLLIGGSGVVQAGATTQLVQLAELLPRAMIAATPRALGVFSSRLPSYAGVIGFGGQLSVDLGQFDLVLVLGTRLHEMSTNFDDRLYAKRLVHIDIDPDVPGHIYAAEAYCAELSVALSQLTAALRDNDSEAAPHRSAAS